MPREYTMRKRADASRQTRERIVQATMQLHDEKGVAPTTFADIARRAGIGQATLHRHFPTFGDLVQTCGQHAWQEMRPLVPDVAGAVFEGLAGEAERLERLFDEVDAFYLRGAHRLALAARDRELVPELHQFLSAVEAGVQAHVAEALAPSAPPGVVADAATALFSFPVWQRLRQLDLPDAGFKAFMLRLVQCAMKAARQPGATQSAG
ncbi:TetR/AcrR family transcriptional regulator [Mesorhizobium sp. ZMM04-5]|uniref:TetR/AcrR family transcriptional regulator n=1 Tax=Mesorhizobium marinum TaxID=3228790 RepID=A0ABV3QVU1_9HYPH